MQRYQPITTIGELALKTPRLVLSTQNTVMDALDMMEAHERYVVGVEENGKFAGMFAYEDYLARVLLKSVNPKTALLQDYMDVTCLRAAPEVSIETAHEMLKADHKRYLPITRDGVLLCVLSDADLSAEISNAYLFSIKAQGELAPFFSAANDNFYASRLN